jgi:hypothetical protein
VRRADGQGDGSVRITFTADEAGTSEDDGVVTTGVKGGDEYLLFMRGLDDSNIEDWGVYFECGDQIYGAAYDCIKACVLDRCRLDVELSKPIGRPKAIKGFRVALTLSNTQLETLIAGLKKVFRNGSNVLKVMT